MRYARLHLILLAVSLAGSSSSVVAKNRAVEYMKYFSPLPQKNYLNESQDRLIKKQKFKSEDLPPYPAAPNRELGFFAILPKDKVNDEGFVRSLLTNERASGISVTLPWRSLEPQEEKYDWAVVDKLLALCAQTNKLLILRVSSCGVDLPEAGAEKPSSDTPAWVYEAGCKSVKYIDSAGKAHLMPIFWDQNYLAAFSNFVTEMGGKYDGHPSIHSVGITGGGFLGGTSIVPTSIPRKGGAKTEANDSGFTSQDQIERYLRKEHGLSQAQIIEHWKYVADLFPQAFPKTSLNFAINPPTPNRAGEDALDQISDYLIYRYGQHVFITRQNVSTGKHKFDDWRVLIKFKPDTYEGLALSAVLPADDMQRLSKTALDDGVSFIEMPAELIVAPDDSARKALESLQNHLGYQLVSKKASVQSEVAQGQPLKGEFGFLNVGAATPKRAVRELDKDVCNSYKMMVELKDQSGKPVAQLLHTPETGTPDWKPGTTVEWQDAFKMPVLPIGEYDASISLFDPLTKRRLRFVDGRGDQPVITEACPVGKVRVVAGTGPSKGILESMKK